MMGVILLSILVVGMIMLAMALGQRATKRCLRGSCGGLGAGDDTSDERACQGCSLRPKTRPPETGARR